MKYSGTTLSARFPQALLTSGVMRLLLFMLLLTPGLLPAQVPTPPRRPLTRNYSLEELQKRSFYYFWDLADVNGQIPDRWPNVSFSSVAATGFGLTSYIIGSEHRWITREQAAERTMKTLRILLELPQGDAASGMSGYKGFFYHFLDHKKSHRYEQVELSTIDSGLLLMGILSAQSYFSNNTPVERTIRDYADQLYRRVDWTFMLNEQNRLSMGWKPERGFLNAEWWGYNEAMLLYVLALGSPTHPIPAESWTAWCQPYYMDTYQGESHVNFGPLFGHQYSHAWIDFKGIQDPYMAAHGMDYFENSRRATLSNRKYCLENPGKFKGYGPNCWGLTACDGPVDWAARYDPKQTCTDSWKNFNGYNARGVATDYRQDDGTIAPTAAGGSLPFAPEVCLPALDFMWTTYYDSLVGQFGFKDAFNLSFNACGKLPGGWFDTDYLGIDQGPIVLMIENYRSQLIWNLMRRNPYIVNGLKRAGFKGGWLDDSKITVQTDANAANGAFNPDVPLDPKPFFARGMVREGKTAVPYRLVSPATMPAGFRTGDATGKYPLVVFLHGSGERGNNNEAQLQNAVLAFVERDFYRANPCYILAPQCPEEENWGGVSKDWNKVVFEAGKPSVPGKLVLKLIDSLIVAQPGIDKNRIYILGLSMGGFGTFDLLMQRPELFAAGIPMCGGGDTAHADRIKQIPLWVMHGTRDEAVFPQYSRNMVAALRKAGSSVKYTEYNTLGHAMWEQALYNPEVMKWLFEQRKK